MTLKDPKELAARDAAVLAYANASHWSVAEIWAWKSVVPARLDHSCDAEDCGGWHFLPKNFYDQKDVDVGFVKAEILEWQ